jgi:hypothetical protein
MVEVAGLRRSASHAGRGTVAREVSLDEFRVMMGVFRDAIAVVGRESTRVTHTLSEVSGSFSMIAHHWQSPAELTLTDLAHEFDSDAADLNDLLAEIHRRMGRTFENYRQAEIRAEQNLTQKQPPPQSLLRLRTETAEGAPQSLLMLRTETAEGAPQSLARLPTETPEAAPQAPAPAATE